MSDSFTPWLANAAKAHPDRIAIQIGSQSLTYLQLYQAAACFARSHDISGESCVAVISNNCIEQVIVSHGVMLTGGTLAHINHRLSAGEIAEQLNRIAPDCTMVESERFSDIEGVGVNSSLISLDAVMQIPKSQAVIPFDTIPAENTCAIFMTSGTTGKPKAVQLSYRNFITSAISSALNLGISQDDRWLACLPLDHIGGFSIIVRSAIYGTEIEVHSGFDPKQVQQSLESNNVSLMSLVPTMLTQLLDAGVKGTESLRGILLGGGRTQEELVQRAWDSGLPVLPTYGLTEACSQVTTMPPEMISRKAGSAGKPIPMVSVKIMSENLKSCRPGETGEIYVNGPVVMKGYLDDPDSTSAAFYDGWVRTGDYGYLDEDGYLYPVARRDDLVVSGGENIYPKEVESVLAKHGAIDEVCVFGIDDEEWGEKLVAAIVLKPGINAKSTNFSSENFPELASYKFPKKLFFMDEIPKTSLGKPKRNILRDQFSQ